MIAKYEDMTPEQIARTLTPRMRDALFASIETEHVDAPTGTSVALIDRGLVEGGRVHPLTDRGREVAAFIWPEQVERKQRAERYERRTGRSAHGLTVEVLRVIGAELHGRTCCSSTDGDVHNRECGTAEARKQWAPAGSAHGPVDNRGATRATRACCSTTIGSEHGDTCASIGARCERAVEAMRNPAPTRRVDELDAADLGTWRVGQGVLVDATFAEPGDVWTIRELVERDGGDPYAAIELTHRARGLPFGTTRSAVGLEWLRELPRPAAPRGTISLTETLMSTARTAASSRGQFVEYDVMRAALRAAFEAVGLRVDVTPGIDEPAPPRPASATDALREVVRQLDGFVTSCMTNDEHREVRDRETDPERYPLMPGDVRVMVKDAAREIGVSL